MTIMATFDATFDRIVAVALCFRKFGGTIIIFGIRGSVFLISNA